MKTFMFATPTFDLRKVILLVILLGLVGFAWWTFSPAYFTTQVHEPLTTSDVSSGFLTYRSGSFEAVGDRTAAGTVHVINRGNDIVVRFEDDFSVPGGPDLRVYFGANDAYDAHADLGALKGNEGSQNYIIPNEIDYSVYSEVWIVSRFFRMPFAVAKLQ